MSTLVAQTISNGTVSTSSANVIQGSAKAWANFNGGFGSGAASVRASYNFSSITKVTTGQYTLALTNAMSDTNYATVSGGSFYDSTTSVGEGIQAYVISTSSIGVTTGSEHAYSYFSTINVAVFR
jgi:hypothetical protein